MSNLIYTSVSHQRKQPLPCALAMAEHVSDLLSDNAVLLRAEISASPAAQGAGSLIGIQAEVRANSANQLGVLMALNAADEQWCYALAGAGCVPCTGPSQLRVQGHAC